MAKKTFQSRPARRRPKRNEPKSVRPGKTRWFVMGMFVLAFFTGWIWLMEVRISPVVRESARDAARNVATLVLSQSVERQLPTMPDVGELIESGSAGSNTRISQLDFTKLTDFQHRVEEDANKNLKNLSKQTVKVPIAQLIGATWLSPFAAQIPIHISVSGRVNSTMDVVTRPTPPDAATHVVYLKLNARVRVQTPFQSKPVTVQLVAPVTYFTLSPRH